MDAGPTAHSVPVDVLCEENLASCLRAAEPVRGERECKCLSWGSPPGASH